MGKWQTLIIVAGILVALSGCTLINTGDTATDPYDRLTAQQVETAQAQTAALALWDRVIFGEIVSCQESFPVPAPLTLSESDRRAYPAASAIEAKLNAALQAVRNSADLWNIECAEDRPYVPLSMARAGREAALAASDPLAEAMRLLAAW